MARQKHILVAALHWGLGHAVRCIPIINYLLDQSCKVSIASDGQALLFLRKQFPELDYFELASYQVTYPTRSIYFNLALKAPFILSAIAKEHKAINKLQKDHQFDGIISDNRYGCYHEQVPSILITHQLNLIGNNGRVQKSASAIHHSMIKKFDDCWVPDIETSPGLSGAMSHGTFDFAVKYLGILSTCKLQTSLKISERELMIVLSGPEPQRTYFEKLLLNQLQTFERKALLVRGIVQDAEPLNSHNPNVHIVNYLNRLDMKFELQNSKVLLCRSGYTSIMDLAKLKMPAILIPTPGQPEQKFLSDNLNEQGIFYHSNQDKLNLSKAIAGAVKTKTLNNSEFDIEAYKDVLSAFVNRI